MLTMALGWFAFAWAMTLEATTPEGPRVDTAWVDAVGSTLVRNTHTLAEARIALYTREGEIDPAAVDDFAKVASADGSAPPLSPRLVQLAVKASHHFHGAAIAVVSAFREKRKGKGSKHSSGEALDFRLEGVRANALASYLRRLPRAGVGIYTHPRTQYVHLDVRDESFHWIDSSPPGVTWREQGLGDYGRAKRDAAYRVEDDLPID